MHPLVPGTRVGAWRVKAWQGQGAYGAVYRAERAGFRRSGPVALKVSLTRWNWRMEREVELLCRLSHPSIPRLLDRGGPSSGEEYPYFAMEWVQGVGLYGWAEEHAPTGKQVCWVLAQLARALEAVHAAGAVHRDVKGDNVLVRLSDRRGVLIDFGSCHFAGVPRLTWQSLPPMTPEYLSPQAARFYLRAQHHPEGYYEPSPADDLYALGVTAYRLVMGQYPGRMEARQDEQGHWQVPGADLRPLMEGHSQVEPLLRQVLMRLLSEAAEARGTAGQVAEVLEAVAGETGEAEACPEHPEAVVRPWTRRRWLTLAAAGACVVGLWSWQQVPRAPSDAQAPEAGTTALGDSSTAKPQDATSPATDKSPLAQSIPPEPRLERARPDKRGRCPGPEQVPINGGCWLEFPSMSAERCTENGNVLFKGKCYVPAFVPAQKTPPTSSPAEAR